MIFDYILVNNPEKLIFDLGSGDYNEIFDPQILSDEDLNQFKTKETFHQYLINNVKRKKEKIQFLADTLFEFFDGLNYKSDIYLFRSDVNEFDLLFRPDFLSVGTTNYFNEPSYYNSELSLLEIGYPNNNYQAFKSLFHLSPAERIKKWRKHKNEILLLK